MRSAFTSALLLACAIALPASAQRVTLAGGDVAGRGGVPAVPSTTEAVAVRATRAPVIDGRDDDAIWATAQVITGFRVFDPVEDGDPRFRTEARVAYDERNLYVA